MFEDARAAGIVFLDEGTHTFTLENGALLTVYASPYTPALGAWGFRYHLERGHDFSIGEGVDVLITHGPSKGIMDFTYGRERAGCSDLFAAVAQAKPRLHCFGHIHEGWGAKLVSWRDSISGQRPTHFTAIDNHNSPLIGKLAGLEASRFDTDDDAERRSRKLARYSRDRCCKSSHCAGDEYPIGYGKQTLFVNASVTGVEDSPLQRPWRVEIELPGASVWLRK